MRHCVRSLLVLVMLMLIPGVGQAHPHVWIINRVTPHFSGTNLVSVELDWRFDEIFSQQIESEFDTDHNHAFSPAESQAVHDNAFQNLKNFGYFTRVRQGAEIAEVKEVKDFKARLDGHVVAYHFTLVLTKSFDIKTAPVSIGIFDDTYFVDVSYPDKDPFSLSAAPSGCTGAIVQDHEHPIYAGLVFPSVLRLSCS